MNEVPQVPVVDFETEAIDLRPNYPPKPVSVSVWKPGEEKPKFYAWGHPTENNCTFEEGKRAVAEVWDQSPLFHNSRFDIEVAHDHLGLPRPRDFHDTLFLLFLNDPHAGSHSLKPSAHRLLGMPPDEQDAVKAWVLQNVLGATEKEWGAHIGKAPGELVGIYADGDTIRTRGLFEKLYPRAELQPYERELRLVEILNANEKEGIRVDLAALESDAERVYVPAFERITEHLSGLLGPINFDSGAELAQALLSHGLCVEDDFLRTPTGKLATNKYSLAKALALHPDIRQAIGYRGNLKTALGTFYANWIRIARLCGGRVHPQLNQTRGVGDYGTRTGRFSSSNPNFQNIPTEFAFEAPEGYPEPPAMRRYILPDEGQVLVSLDFASQEFRVMAHFAEGRAAEIYRDDPKADFHQIVSDLLEQEAGLHLPRKPVKIVGFSLLYGAGVKKLAESLGVDFAVAQKIRRLYFQVLPGVAELMEDVSSRGRHGQPVRTWGGRVIYAEPPRVGPKGEHWDFSYKLLNYLIQGSAADQTKETIIRGGYKTRRRRFLTSVHDQNVYSVDPQYLDQEVKNIRAIMEDPTGWDVPWKCTVEYGPNWWDLKDYE